MTKAKTNIYPQGASVIVDFGDIVIDIPSGHKTDISDVRLGRYGTVYFKANGKEDLLSIVATVFGEHPYYRPFIYHIIKDERNLGIEGLYKCVVDLLKKDKGLRGFTGVHTN